VLGHFQGITISMALNPAINIANIIALPRKWRLRHAAD